MTDLSAYEEGLIRKTLRNACFDFNDEMINLFLKLEPQSRLNFLSERCKPYDTYTRALSLIIWAVLQNKAPLVTEILTTFPQAPEIRAYHCLERALSESVGRGIAFDILLVYANNSPNTLCARLESPIRQNEDTREISGSFFRLGFRFENLGPEDLSGKIHDDYMDHLRLITQILFRLGVPYLSSDVKCCALRKAAIWHKEKHVRLFLTGGLHTAADAANAIELLQVGSLRHQLMTKYDKSSLTYFREAHRIREDNQIGGGFSSLQEIEDMEARIAGGDFSKLIEYCFRLIVLNHFDYSNRLNDRLNIYQGQSWLFFHFSDLRQLLQFIIGTSALLKDDAPNALQEKFWLKLSDLLLMYQPDWKELVMIFHSLRLSPWRSPRWVDWLEKIFARLDLQTMREVIEGEPTGIVGSLILSYCADIVMLSRHPDRLDEIVLLLLDTGAKLYIRRESHGPMQDELKERAGGDLVFFDLDREKRFLCDSKNTRTTYHRLMHSTRNPARIIGEKMMLVSEKLEKATCCDLDVKTWRSLTEPSKLICLAARQCSEYATSCLPGPVRRMVLEHIIVAVEGTDDSIFSSDGSN